MELIFTRHLVRATEVVTSASVHDRRDPDERPDGHLLPHLQLHPYSRSRTHTPVNYSIPRVPGSRTFSLSVLIFLEEE